MKEFSQWQVSRVRNALRAFYRYERDHDGESLTLGDVREAIAEYTGYEIGGNLKYGKEQLRTFLDGIKDRNAPSRRKLSEPTPAAFKAILAFLTHKDLNLLTEDEIQNYNPGFQAPLRLLEYLKQKFDTEHLMSPEALEGQYRTQNTNGDDLIFRDLTMQRSSQNGLVQVSETEDIYDQKDNPLIMARSIYGQRAKRSMSYKYGGWAILTPEQNLLFFMKEERSGMNRYYFTLFSDMTRKMDKPMNKFVLIQHDYPFEPEKDETQNMDDIIKELKEEFSNNLLAFERC